MIKPIVDESKCEGCKLCVDVCPIQIFEMDDNNKAKVIKDGCIGCKSCEIQCPHGAIVIEED